MAAPAANWMMVPMIRVTGSGTRPTTPAETKTTFSSGDACEAAWKIWIKDKNFSWEMPFFARSGEEARMKPRSRAPGLRWGIITGRCSGFVGWFRGGHLAITTALNDSIVGCAIIPYLSLGSSALGVATPSAASSRAQFASSPSLSLSLSSS